jgi:hypothetical protein
MSYDLRPFIRWIVDEFEPSVRLGGPAGSYARQVGQKEPELYGVADMACILYTLGRLRPGGEQRRQWADSFAQFQDPRTGYIVERSPTHDKLHNTAFALAAMDLLDIPPRHALAFARQYADPEALRVFLRSLNWTDRVYPESHKGAGLASIFALSPGLCAADWFSTYFLLCDSLFDPANGMMGRDKPPGGDSDQIGGTFHYHFIYEHFHRRMPYPQARIDAILALQQPDGYWHPANHLWLTLDAIYMLTRTLRYAHHRPADVERVVRRVLDVLMADVLSGDGPHRHFGGKMGVHSLTAVVSLLAEAQQFLGAHEVVSDWPLRLVLDRRPFI